MTQISESGLSFSFLDNVDVKKFDDTKFYRSYYNNLPNCKRLMKNFHSCE